MKVWSRLSLKTRILMIVSMASALTALISITGFLHFTKLELENGIINKERTIHTQLGAAVEFVAKQGGLKGVVEKFRSKYTSASQLNDVEKREILSQVPIYAGMVIGKTNAEIDHYEFRVFSDEPRLKENQANAEEMKVFNRFAADPNLSEIVQKNDDTLTVFKPVRLSESQGCITCHGSPETSPWGNGTDILGFKMEGWKDGKLHGVFAVSQNIKKVARGLSARKNHHTGGMADCGYRGWSIYGFDPRYIFGASPTCCA